MLVGAIKDKSVVFRIVDSSNPGELNFAETDSGTVCSIENITEYLVHLDFADFANSRVYTTPDVLESYSVGITLFHEFSHKVSYEGAEPIPESGVRPDKSSGETKGAIEITNDVRMELGLIPRAPKPHRGRLYRGPVERFRKTQEIRFKNGGGRRKYLRWMA